eukprot:937327-Pyramimonas_sp.AAC.1
MGSALQLGPASVFGIGRTKWPTAKSRRASCSGPRDSLQGPGGPITAPGPGAYQSPPPKIEVDASGASL